MAKKMTSVGEETRARLISYAAKYETADFLAGDPSWFMHQVTGGPNQETLAFVASALSYGSRKQFFPKIQGLLDASGGDVYQWVKSGAFERHVPDTPACFYRLYTCHAMNSFMRALRQTLLDHGTLGALIKQHGGDTLASLQLLCAHFASLGASGVVPKDTTSACKRLCMFMRWMVRDDSPVDLGLWSLFVDKRTLIMPLDTHVVHEAARLGLLGNTSASMTAARRLTSAMLEVFPDDPLKGDFALFGYGVDTDK